LSLRWQQALTFRDITDIDYESIPVRPVDCNRETDPLCLLVEGNSVNLYHLDSPVGGEFKETYLVRFRRPNLNRIAVSGLLDAAFCQISDRTALDGASF
jgi:hypothetical protein